MFSIRIPEPVPLSLSMPAAGAEGLRLPPHPEAAQPVSVQAPAPALPPALDPETGLNFAPARLLGGPMDQMTNGMSRLPPGVYRVDVPDRARSDGMVRSFTVHKVDENTFIVRHDWECNGPQNEVFVFRREGQGTPWNFSIAEDRNGALVPASRDAVAAMASDTHWANRGMLALNKINQNISNMRNEAVISGAAQHRWFDPARPPSFTDAGELTRDIPSLQRLPNGVSSLRLEDGSVLTVQKMDNGTFAVSTTSGNPAMRETVILTQSGGRWWAAQVREQNGIIGDTPLTAAQRTAWSNRLEVLGEDSAARTMTGG